MIADLFATPHPDNLAWKIAENLLPDTTATAFTTAMSTFAGSLAFFGSLFVGFPV